MHQCFGCDLVQFRQRKTKSYVQGKIVIRDKTSMFVRVGQRSSSSEGIFKGSVPPSSKQRRCRGGTKPSINHESFSKSNAVTPSIDKSIDVSVVTYNSETASSAQQCFSMTTMSETISRLQCQAGLNNRCRDRQKARAVEGRWSLDGVMDGEERALLTAERLRDHKTLVQSVMDRSLPGKGQVY